MSKEFAPPIRHHNYSNEPDTFDRLSYGEADEHRELAVDAQTMGALAISSEIEAAQAVDQRLEIEIPNPITPKMLRSKASFRMALEGEDAWKWKWIREQDESAVDADSTLRRLEEELRQLEEKGDAASSREYLSKKLATTKGQYGSAMSLEGIDFVLRDMDIPPFLSMLKEGDADTETSWSKWLRMASDEQLINFSQWYTEQLKKHLDPESRATIVEELKQNYLDSVHKAMEQGWIDERYKKVLGKRIDAAQIIFFSPFGNFPNRIGGQVYKKTMFLPAPPSSFISMHEFGHIFAGLSSKGALKYLDALPSLGAPPLAFEQIYTIINEGFNEHMTVALQQGSFDIISPSEREKAGLTEPNGASEGYRLYREIFGALIAGRQDDGSISQAEIRELTGTMVRRDFDSFADFVSKRWAGRDMIKEIYSLLTEIESKNGAGIRRGNDNYEAAEATLSLLAPDKAVSSAA